MNRTTCSDLTRKGVECKRIALPRSNYCAQHEKIQQKKQNVKEPEKIHGKVTSKGLVLEKKVTSDVDRRLSTKEQVKEAERPSSDLLWDTSRDDVPKLTEFLRTIPLLNKYYQVKERFANGLTGHLFNGIHIASKKPVALKVVVMDEHSLMINSAQPLQEAKILRKFTSDDHHIVHLIDQFIDIPYGNDLWICILVMEKLDIDLAKWAKQHDQKDSKHMECQMVSMLKQLHSKQILSTDVKPLNICVRNVSNKLPELVLIDLGSAMTFEQYKDIIKGEVPAGTGKYASLRILQNIGFGFADDLESLAYCLWEVLSGPLPWNYQTPIDKIIEMKTHLPGCPSLIAKLIKYCRDLGDDQPNYDQVFQILQLKPSCDQTLPNKPTIIEPTAELAFENGYTKDFLMIPVINNNTRIQKLLNDNNVKNYFQLIAIRYVSQESIDMVKKLITFGFTKQEANLLTERIWAKTRTIDDVGKPFRPLL